ncbi:MAG: transporter substrate-binding domain-containing protein [Verrucomicrobia bacterium]|nr:MAG: transporter substrate-binding domain-containing protein [Verrucomicrobiota bacterium]MDH4469900.1 transporter substrate-binding domain-containing protein [Verrucomicrobiae bacterium]
MNKYLFVLIALFFSSLLACQKKSSSQPLRVGMDLSFPPFEMIDAQGNPDGISVQLSQALGDDLHRKVEIENIPFVGLIPSLQTKKIDLIISSMTDTPERRQSIAFSDPYLTLSIGILTHQQSPIHRSSDLNHPGIKIAVRQGTIGEQWAEKNLTQATVIMFDQEATAVLEVLENRVDGFIYDVVSIWKFYKAHPDQTVALLNPLEVSSSAIGVRLEDQELLQKVNHFLKTFREQQGFEKLGNQYLREQKEYFAEQGIPFYL